MLSHHPPLPTSSGACKIRIDSTSSSSSTSTSSLHVMTISYELDLSFIRKGAHKSHKVWSSAFTKPPWKSIFQKSWMVLFSVRHLVTNLGIWKKTMVLLSEKKRYFSENHFSCCLLCIPARLTEVAERKQLKLQIVPNWKFKYSKQRENISSSSSSSSLSLSSSSSSSSAWSA